MRAVSTRFAASLSHVETDPSSWGPSIENAAILLARCIAHLHAQVMLRSWGHSVENLATLLVRCISVWSTSILSRSWGSSIRCSWPCGLMMSLLSCSWLTNGVIGASQSTAVHTVTDSRALTDTDSRGPPILGHSRVAYQGHVVSGPFNVCPKALFYECGRSGELWPPVMGSDVVCGGKHHVIA